MTHPDLAQFLRDQRNHITSRFVSEVQRKDLSPPGIARSLLVDHIPKFLDEIVAELEHGAGVRMSQDAIDTSETARQHGEQRWGLGYDLEGLIREYGILRHCLLEAAKEAGAQFSLDEFDVLAKCLSVGVAEAATAYAKYRDEQLNARNANLEFLAVVSQLLSSSLDYRATLSRLTGLLVPGMADYCAVHLDGATVDEMPLAHVDPAKLALLRDSYRLEPLPGNSPHDYPRVLQTGEASIVRVVDPDYFDTAEWNPDYVSLLRTLGTCSWIIVPLRVQGTIFGALTLAYSDSRRHYEPHDLILASEVARRAAVAIDNARLYDLSQKERSRVEAATRAKDEFVAMVSHELRTPLNSIIGWLYLIRGGALSDERRDNAIEVIERNARAQSQIISDLLDISRVITGKIRIAPSQVDLSNVVDMTIEGVRPAAEAKRIALEVNVDSDHAVMRGDSERLQQVVWILVANAVKFTPKNGAVRVRLRRIESDLELTVEDTGKGIAPDFLPHIFETFRQPDTSITRPHGGLGIGLSIAKHLVELHGGSIEGQSEGIGRGATFVVRLPISPLVSATLGISRVPATKREAANITLPVGLEDIRVLLVDDEADARELVTFVLEKCGMEVRVAGSAAEAMTALEDYTPHVIISDIGLPDENGYALIRSIRTLSADDKKNIPAIALTAFVGNENRTRALVEGFNLHMGKPVEPTALVKAVVDLARHMRR